MNKIPIPGYEEYQVTSDGRVYRGQKELHLRVNERGYVQADLWKHNKRKAMYVHRLVALAFIPNPDSKPWVDHINGDRADNTVDNLRWVNATENNNNHWTHRRISELEAENQELREYIAYLESRA